MNLSFSHKNITHMCAVLFALSSSFAQAAFVNTDINYAGDARAVLDTSTGLEWLDLGYTGSGWSIQGISNLIKAGGSMEGWRFPTKAEVGGMMTNWFGMPSSSYNVYHYGGYPSSVVNFYNTFNWTNRAGEWSNGHVWSQGVYMDAGQLYVAGVYHRNSWG